MHFWQESPRNSAVPLGTSHPQACGGPLLVIGDVLSDPRGGGACQGSSLQSYCLSFCD